MVRPVLARVGGRPLALYAGGTNPGVVYRYDGGTTWTVVSPSLGWSVSALAVYGSKLYAGTIGDSRWGPTASVWRYDGGTTWTQVASGLGSMVTALTVRQNRLYAGTSWSGALLYRYEDSPGSWTLVVADAELGGFRAAYSAPDGYLYLGDYTYDRIGRYDGSGYTRVLGEREGSCIWDFASYGGNLWASAYEGLAWTSGDGATWTSQLLSDNHGDAWGLEVYQGSLCYCETPTWQSSAIATRVCRFGGGVIWSEALRGDTYLGLGAICLLASGNKLYWGYGGESTYHDLRWLVEGRVYAYDGASVQQIGSGMGLGVQSLCMA